MHCDIDNGNYDVPRCKTFSEGICIECEDEGFHPIRINNGQKSLCVNIGISDLCEEYDFSVLGENSQISCKRCKTMEQIKDDVQNGLYKLTRYDFFSKLAF